MIHTEKYTAHRHKAYAKRRAYPIDPGLIFYQRRIKKCKCFQENDEYQKSEKDDLHY